MVEGVTSVFIIIYFIVNYLPSFLFFNVWQTWAEEIWQMPKLRTYYLFKKDWSQMSKNMFNIICIKINIESVYRTRCGILPLRVETIREEGRIFEYCEVKREENESFHPLLSFISRIMTNIVQNSSMSQI